MEESIEMVLLDSAWLCHRFILSENPLDWAQEIGKIKRTKKSSQKDGIFRFSFLGYVL